MRTGARTVQTVNEILSYVKLRFPPTDNFPLQDSLNKASLIMCGREHCAAANTVDRMGLQSKPCIYFFFGPNFGAFIPATHDRAFISAFMST